ncbi:MAG: DUF63 family protein [Halolamina sp.]
MVLPAGSSVPPLPQVALLLAATVAVAWGLHRERVRITDRTILALSPWMVAGATAYVVYQLEVIPPAIAPFFGSPAVYATTFVIAGVVWLLARGTTRTKEFLGGVGLVAMVIPTAVALAVSADDGLEPVLPLLGVAIAALVAWATWWAFGVVRPRDASTVGVAGPVVVFGHALDAISTAIGVDLLGFGERTPLSALILDGAGALPTADVIGVGWLFVLVKLAVATLVLWLLAGYVRDEPGEGFTLLGVVAAVGLGPGAHNVLLFVVLGPTGF